MTNLELLNENSMQILKTLGISAVFTDAEGHIQGTYNNYQSKINEVPDGTDVHDYMSGMFVNKSDTLRQWMSDCIRASQKGKTPHYFKSVNYTKEPAYDSEIGTPAEFYLWTVKALPVIGIDHKNGTEVLQGFTFMFQKEVNALEANIVDSMTHLLNHGGFEKTAEELLRDGSEKYINVICDLNGFKLINDNYGHGAGDNALKSFAKELGRYFNVPGVTVGRVGGDEFSVLMPYTPENLQLANEFNDKEFTFIDNGREIPYSTCAGVATSNRYEPYAELRERADSRLLKNKEIRHEEHPEELRHSVKKEDKLNVTLG